MLNTLVNSTDAGLCNKNELFYNKSCMDEIFECICTVQCQTDMNTEALDQIHDCLQTTNVSATNVSADSICTSSICTNAILSVGIEANNMQSQCLNVAGKATVGNIESNGIVKAESVQTQSISTENITGLQSLTVEGQATVDKLQADEIETAGKVTASSIEAITAEVTSLESTNIDTSNIDAVCVDTDSIDAEEANIQKACIGSLSTSNFSSDEIATSKISSTSLSVPKLETSGGITGKGTIDTTSPVWKEIKIPLFTGTVQFYTDEWKVTINGGREFIWEDPSLDHLKFLSNDGETITVAVDWDGEVFYTYNVSKEEPILSFADNTGHTPDDDHTYIMQDSGVPRGTVYIYQDKEFTNQGLTILGKVKASNLEITCGESIDCLSVGNLCVTNSIVSDNPIDFNVCARNFCISSPCTYIDNCLCADHLEANCICANGHLWADNLYFDTIQVVNCAESPKSVVVYENGLLCDSYKVCVDDDTVYSQKSCACDFYGNLHGKANDTCCFDGRLFCDACFEILSGKACTAGLADNSCCFDGRLFCDACFEILSGKACTAGMADCAKNVCIWCLWAGTEPDWGYVPFADPYTGCLVQARIDTGYSNPMVAYNEYGLVCLEIRGCVCVNDDPLIANRSIATRYLKADDMRVCEDALITNLCSCKSYTERLYVNKCAKFNGPAYFYGNIYQCGASYCTHAQNIYTCSDTITMREGADFAGDAQIKVLKYDGTNNGIIQLGTDGTLRIGDETNCQPVLTRSEEADICDGHVLVWDATNRCAKDGGDAIVTCDYVHCVGTECAKASCEYGCKVAKTCDEWNRCYTKTMDRICYNCLEAEVCNACIASYNHADLVGTCCFQKSCCCSINMDNMCLACAYKCSYCIDSNVCSFAVSCSHGIGTDCKNAACTFAVSCSHAIGTECKNAACTYASSVGGQCKSAACTYACTVAFCNVNTCKGIGVMGVARGIDAQCWTKAGYWAYMTMKDGPNCCWNHVIKTDWSTGVDVWSSGISIPTYNAPQNGIHYKVRCCGGTTGWTLVPDITCVQNVGLSCRNLAEACACSFAATCGHAIGTSCKNAACSFVVSCGHEIGTACKNASTATKADCYGKSTSCVACANLARKVDLEAYNATNKRFIYLGQPDSAKNIGCNPNLWFCPTCNIMTMGDANGTALCLIGKGSCCMGGICSKLNPKIVFASTDNQCGCLQYSQYDGVHPGAGLCWQTNTPNSWFQTDCIYANKYLDASGVVLPTCTYVSTVGGQCKSAACTYASSVGGQCKSAACSFAVSCGHAIGTSCRNLAEACACSFAATCAQAVAPETSTFAKCYGNSTNCVAYANQVRVGVSSGNAYYKIPFTGTTGTTTSNQSLYIDNANAFPSYNPSTNVFCGYTVCVAQTLAVRNANGGFRLGNYCIYIA